jgi:two-component system NtrC family response regulator
LQVKLLRVVQEREIDKIGSPHPVKVNVRILAASNRNLKNRIADGQFREDLYYRLSVVTIDLPPLRERRDDIPLLIQHFLKQLADRYSLADLSVSDNAREKLMQYNWPGNVRELQNVMERMAVLTRNGRIQSEDLPAEIRQCESRIANIFLKLPDEGIDLEEIEKEILVQSLEKHGWNQTRAAAYLNISRKTLIYRMEKFSLIAPISEPVE